jgi:hypothetical protein
MNTIEETVTETLARDGTTLDNLGTARRLVDHAIEALVVREEDLARQLVVYAKEQGLGEDEARSVLSDLGMHVSGYVPPMPGSIASAEAANEAEAMGTPAQQPDPEQRLTDAVLQRITETLDDLSDFARQHGFRPRQH